MSSRGAPPASGTRASVPRHGRRRNRAGRPARPSRKRREAPHRRSPAGATRSSPRGSYRSRTAFRPSRPSTRRCARRERSARRSRTPAETSAPCVSAPGCRAVDWPARALRRGKRGRRGPPPRAPRPRARPAKAAGAAAREARPRGRGSSRGAVAQRREIPRQVLRRSVPILRIFRQTAFHDPQQVRRHFRRRDRERLRLGIDDRRERLRRRRTLEGPLARRHLVEDRAEGELIGSEVHRLSAGLLRRHVSDGAEDRPGFGPARDGRTLHSLRGLETHRVSLARPKSRILTKPSRVTIRFSGFKSR